jgi:hypothetical protein
MPRSRPICSLLSHNPEPWRLAPRIVATLPRAFVGCIDRDETAWVRTAGRRAEISALRTSLTHSHPRQRHRPRGECGSISAGTLGKPLSVSARRGRSANRGDRADCARGRAGCSCTRRPCSSCGLSANWWDYARSRLAERNDFCRRRASDPGLITDSIIIKNVTSRSIGRGGRGRPLRHWASEVSNHHGNSWGGLGSGVAAIDGCAVHARVSLGAANRDRWSD